jgi:hypothetical protein
LENNSENTLKNNMENNMENSIELSFFDLLSLNGGFTAVCAELKTRKIRIKQMPTKSVMCVLSQLYAEKMGWA